MKKIIALILALVLVAGLTACGAKPEITPEQGSSTSSAAPEAPAPENPVIRLSTTTSVNDSGLLPYLLPAFEAETGYKVEVQSAGTGAAIQKAIDGNADVILVHADSPKVSSTEHVLLMAVMRPSPSTTTFISSSPNGWRLSASALPSLPATTLTASGSQKMSLSMRRKSSPLTSFPAIQRE